MKKGLWRQRNYHVAACTACGFAFVENPDTDFANIYTESYYRGLGADPLVDYVSETRDPATVRRFEWQGIAEIVAALVELSPSTRWLDYGCGMGGFVDFLSTTLSVQAEGFEEETPAECDGLLKGRRISTDVLGERAGYYDVITAIEVLEHVFEPRAVLARVSDLLKPGGLFFYTTGNAARFRENLLAWEYVRPEIHVSFYEPRTMKFALEQSGLDAVSLHLSKGFENIVKFKILKALRFKRIQPWMKFVPWAPIVAAADRRYGVSEFPAGRKPGAA